MGIHFAGPIPPKKVLSFQLFGPATLRPITPQEEEHFEFMAELAKVRDDDGWWLEKLLGGGLSSLSDPRGNLSKARIATSLTSFQSVFDNAWWRSVCQRRKHPPHPFGVLGGQDPLARIVRLGECLHVLGPTTGLPREFVARLKNPSQFQSASTELEVAACFKQAAYDVELFPTLTTGKKPEGRVKVNDQTIYYEVTVESWTEINKQAFKAENLLIQWVSKELGRVNGSIQFHLAAGSPIPRARSALAELRLNVSKEQLPAIFQSKEFDARFESSSGIGGWVGISGLEPEPTQVVNVWIKRVIEKSKQLPPGEAGVIIASPLFLWGPNESEAAVSQLGQIISRQPHTRISGLVFHAKHVEHSGFLKHVPSVLLNPRASKRCDEALSKLAGALFTFPDWL